MSNQPEQVWDPLLNKWTQGSPDYQKAPLAGLPPVNFAASEAQAKKSAADQKMLEDSAMYTITERAREFSRVRENSSIQRLRYMKSIIGSNE